MIRCPVRQGQSNTIHLARSRSPTRATPLRGNKSGTSSADSAWPTMRQRWNGSHFHQVIFMATATIVRGMVLRLALVEPQESLVRPLRWPIADQPIEELIDRGRCHGGREGDDRRLNLAKCG